MYSSYFLILPYKRMCWGGRMRFYCYRYQLPNDYSYLNSQELSSEKLTPKEAKAKKNELVTRG